MKFSATLLAATCLASACHATPEPSQAPAPVADAETAIEPAAPMVIPMVGGPCSYETTYIVATVAQVHESTVEMIPPEGRNFNLPATVFSETPQIGEKARIVKRAIKKGTCTPVMYAYDGPFTDPVPEN
jgi:hypothetical protein